MSRIVQLHPARRDITAFAADPTPPPPAVPEYGERVAKYIPAEILAGYIAIMNLLAASTETGQEGIRSLVAWAAFLGGLVGTWAWLRRFPAPQADLNRHIALAVVAFAIWAYAFPVGVFVINRWYHPLPAGAVLIGFSVISGFFKPRGA